MYRMSQNLSGCDLAHTSVYALVHRSKIWLPDDLLIQGLNGSFLLRRKHIQWHCLSYHKVLCLPSNYSSNSLIWIAFFFLNSINIFLDWLMNNLHCCTVPWTWFSLFLFLVIDKIKIVLYNCIVYDHPPIINRKLLQLTRDSIVQKCMYHCLIFVATVSLKE